MNLGDGAKYIRRRLFICASIQFNYSSSGHNLLEDVVYYVIDGSHVAEICSYRTHASTVILTVRFAMCRDSAVQDDNRVPLLVLSSCYLCLASLVRKVRIRLRTWNYFHCFQPRLLACWSEYLSWIFRRFLVDAARFVVGAMQPLAPPWLRLVPISTRVREMDVLGFSTKNLPNTTHIFNWSRRPSRKALFPTLPFLSKLLTQPPNVFLIGRSHTIVTSKSSLTPEIHVQGSREVTVHPENTHLRLNISLQCTAQHAVQCKIVGWQQCAR